MYILEYANGFRASAWDDTYAGPATERGDLDFYIKWRVEGTEGVAQGWLGWPEYPNRARSRLEFCSSRQPGVWISPRWKQVWFPDAFEGTMGALMDAVARHVEPENGGRDNLETMALVDACYLSLAEHRPVRPAEIKARAARGGR
jgi:predicted dehydrogenase